MLNKEITNEDIMREIKNLYKAIDTVRQMVYETNSDFYNTMQIANLDNRYPFEIMPLTNRELILYAIDKYPVIDPETRRERLMTKDEMIKSGFPESSIMHSFEVNQENYDDEDEL